MRAKASSATSSSPIRNRPFSPSHAQGEVRNVRSARLVLSRGLSLLYRLVLRRKLATGGGGEDKAAVQVGTPYGFERASEVISCAIQDYVDHFMS